jgi:hypothetical protein
MKPFFLSFFLFCFIHTINAQSVTGIWKGTMLQDTPKRAINFEIALQEKEGKLTGYCYRLFIVNDSLIYNTIKVEARIADSILIVEDEKSVSKNYEENTRKIKVAYFFKLKQGLFNGETMNGEWTTNQYKGFRAVTGTVSVTREPDFVETQLYKRLEDKKLHKELKFEVKQTASSTAIATPPPVAADTVQTIAKVTADPQLNPTANKPSVTNTKPKETKIVAPPVVQVEKSATNEIVKQQTPPATKVETKPKPSPVTKEPPVVKQQPVAESKPAPVLVAKPVQEPEQQTVIIDKTAGTRVNNTSDKPILSPAPAILNTTITKRETELIQTVDLAEDSVVLALYDNGEIDGDTVSVFINNEQVIAKAGLKATAYKKTVFVKKGESVQLTLFAENLGSIPPNTGLLVIYSGEQRYQIHFTSTLSKSAVIVLRRQ